MNAEINDIIWSLEEAKKALAAGNATAAASYLEAALGDLKDPAVLAPPHGRQVCVNTLHAVLDDELEIEANGAYGDPRRCEIHGTVTSSPDGAFDAPCGDCEAEMHELYCEEQEAEERAERATPRPWTPADEEQYQRDLLDPTFFNDIPF